MEYIEPKQFDPLNSISLSFATDFILYLPCSSQSDESVLLKVVFVKLNMILVCGGHNWLQFSLYMNSFLYTVNFVLAYSTDWTL